MRHVFVVARIVTFDKVILIINSSRRNFFYCFVLNYEKRNKYRILCFQDCDVWTMLLRSDSRQCIFFIFYFCSSIPIDFRPFLFIVNTIVLIEKETKRNGQRRVTLDLASIYFTNTTHTTYCYFVLVTLKKQKL